MSLFSLFQSPEKNDRVVLLLDIGSISVGVAIVHLAPDKNPSILWSVREIMPVESKPGYLRLLSLTRGSINAALEKLEKEKVLRPILSALKIKELDKIICFLSSPFCVSSTRNIQLSYSEPLELNQKFLSEILGSEEENLLAEISTGLNVQNAAKSRFELVERKIMRAAVNGREVITLYE